MSGRIWILTNPPADMRAPTADELRDAMPLDAFTPGPLFGGEVQSVTVRVVRCLCGKVHCAAGISPSCRCPGCSRRLWPQLMERGR